MSYILEALKKAEAERNGSAPQIPHTPHSFAKSGKHRSGARNFRLWLVFAATVCGLIGLFWFGTMRTTPEPAASMPLPTLPSLPAQATQPAPIPPQAAMTPPDTAVSDPKPAMPKAQREIRAPQAKDEVVKKAPQKITSPTTEESKPAPAAPVEPPLPGLRELPEQIQREIPTLAIGGYIYSGNKADRSVLINNRLMRDGDEIAPGLQLEKMMPNGMVLNYKGYRYRITY